MYLEAWKKFWVQEKKDKLRKQSLKHEAFPQLSSLYISVTRKAKEVSTKILLIITDIQKIAKDIYMNYANKPVSVGDGCITYLIRDLLGEADGHVPQHALGGGVGDILQGVL